MEQDNRISVIVPVYNCERYVAEAIESVLTQTYHPFEVIVVDDGSTDGSADVAKSFTDTQIRYIYQPNSGLSTALNTGVQQARGSLFAFLDSDDVWLPDKLDLQMFSFRGDPELDMVFGHISQFYSPELDSHLQTRVQYAEGVVPGYSAGTMLMKRDSFYRVGLFSPSLRLGQFVDWYSRAMEKGLKSVMLSQVVMRRRIHTSNMGLREGSSKSDYVKILKAVLDRRRQKRVNGQTSSLVCDSEEDRR